MSFGKLFNAYKDFDNGNVEYLFSKADFIYDIYRNEECITD